MKYLLTSLIFLAGPALAQEQSFPGELPVDPYVQSDANAGGMPRPDLRVYEAFHGEAGISRIVDGLVDKAIADPRIEGIFRASDLVRLRRTLKEQISYLLGGPVSYSGRDMETAHRDQGITEREFNALVELLQEAMSEEGVPFWAQNKLVAQLAPMQRDVVTR